MKSQKIFSIHIKIQDEYEISSENKQIKTVLFSGNAESDFFTGKVLPGGVDTQTTINGKTHLSARYMLEGKDLIGDDCHIFIENEADITDREVTTTPKITTDSKTLSWLQYAALEGQIVNDTDGICINIHEQLTDFERTEHIIKKDGKIIYGELYKPVNSSGKLPIVIISHGYNSSSEQMRYEAEELAKRGVMCYAFDFCGGGVNSKSSGTTTEMSIPSETEDLKAVYDEVSSLPFVDTENIYLYGMSQGGLVSALVAADMGSDVKGLFLIFPAFCISDDWAERKKNNKEDFIEFWGMTLGRCFVDNLPDYDLFDRACRYIGNVLIFHGECDPVVNVSYSEKLQKRYKKAALDIYPHQQHWFEGKFTIATSGKIAKVIKDNLN